MPDNYDAIIVGARCAGAPTAMHLAAQGHKVLVVDRATFPSDTVSTHMIHPRGVEALERWGLLDEVVATGCPPIESYSFDFGPVVLRGTARTAAGSSTAYAPRRVVLDKILVDAAAKAGAEVREGFTVEDVLVEDGAVVGIRGHGERGKTLELRSRVTVGADGRSSKVAKAVRPEHYHDKPVLQQGYYSYWRDLPVDGFEIYIRPDRGWAALPTNDDLTLIVGGWPAVEAAAYRADPENNFLRTLDLAPAFADRVRTATRVERFTAASSPNFFRKPFGPGWALVGDAGYTKDPITAQGMSDAFVDSERCAAALDAALTGARSFDEAMDEYQRERDEHALPIYEFTTQLATLEPPPPEMQQLLGALHGNQEAIDGFVSVNAGCLSPMDFFSPDNIGRIMGAAA